MWPLGNSASHLHRDDDPGIHELAADFLPNRGFDGNSASAALSLERCTDGIIFEERSVRSIFARTYLPRRRLAAKEAEPVERHERSP